MPAHKCPHCGDDCECADGTDATTCTHCVCPWCGQLYEDCDGHETENAE